MMTDLVALADKLLANFYTVRIPAPEPIETMLGDFFAPAKVRVAARREVEAVRDNIRLGLAERGHRILHHLEEDPDGGYRLHIFLSDDEVQSVLNETTKCNCGPGDPVDFDPEEFVRERLPECWWVREWR